MKQEPLKREPVRLAAVFALFLALGFGHTAWAQQSERQPAGRLVDVGGYRVHLWRTGTPAPDRPTIVLGPRTPLPSSLRPTYQSPANRSAARIIGAHTVVGAGAGLLIGLVLSGASISDERSTVVVTWTAVGAAAGLVSGVVTWLTGRRN